MKHISFALLAIFFLSCQTNSVKDKIENDEVFEISAEDKEMNDAIKNSIKTFNEFEKAFNNKGTNDEAHAIKVSFETPDGGGEHIWVGDLFQKEDGFYGVVNNSPQATTKVKLGDTIKINLDHMSDWMYLSKGILKGGYTLRVIRNQMSDEEKKQFDESVGFIIED